MLQHELSTRFDLNIFYCIYTKGLNTSSYNLRGSHLETSVRYVNSNEAWR